MSISRRRFMQLGSGLFVAPGFVRADALMKIWTPPEEIILPKNQTYFYVNSGGYSDEQLHFNPEGVLCNNLKDAVSRAKSGDIVMIISDHKGVYYD